MAKVFVVYNSDDVENNVLAVVDPTTIDLAMLREKVDEIDESFRVTEMDIESFDSFMDRFDQ